MQGRASGFEAVMNVHFMEPFRKHRNAADLKGKVDL